MARDYTKIKAWQLSLLHKMLKTPFESLRVNGVYIEIIDFFRSAELVEAQKELEYLDAKIYDELWAKSQEGLRTLQGLISYIEKSGVSSQKSSV